jgi:hypothetical protein
VPKDQSDTDISPRANMRRLLRDLRKKPLAYLPERSVSSLANFFSGYNLLGGPIWPDITQFEKWLTTQLYYPQDSGACWHRFIQLNSDDAFDSYEKFFALYDRYALKIPAAPFEEKQRHLEKRKFDFYLLLYTLNTRPGFYFGFNPSVLSLAALLAGYFKSKNDLKLQLSRDEKVFMRFSGWLRSNEELPRSYPWYRHIEMWNYAGLDSFNCFFANFDAFLTDYGKKARGLDDLFIEERNKKGTIVRRRKKNEMRSKLIRLPESRRWWRA